MLLAEKQIRTLVRAWEDIKETGITLHEHSFPPQCIYMGLCISQYTTRSTQINLLLNRLLLFFSSPNLNSSCFLCLLFYRFLFIQFIIPFNFNWLRKFSKTLNECFFFRFCWGIVPFPNVTSIWQPRTNCFAQPSERSSTSMCCWPKRHRYTCLIRDMS